MAWPIPFPQEIPSKRYGVFTSSYHALKRFYARYLESHPELNQEQKDSVEFFYTKFSKHLRTSVEVERSNRIWQVIAHNMEDALYFRSKGGFGDWIFVTTPNRHVLTCFKLAPVKRAMYRRKVLTSAEQPVTV